MPVFYRFLKRFEDIAHKVEFIKEQKAMAAAVQSALAQGYLDDGSEIDLVRSTIQALNRTPGSFFHVESLFIHGGRSQVQFDYFGKTAKKEVGDLILISTLTFQGSPILQRMTIVQAKKDSSKTKPSWAIDPEQLHLLSTWPVFQGIRGIFSGSNTMVVDHSGCMGSYILFRAPGDAVFVAAPLLGSFMQGKKRMTGDELALLHSTMEQRHHFSFGVNSLGVFRCFNDPDFCLLPFLHFSGKLLQNQLLVANVYEMVNHLALLNIGDFIFSGFPEIKVNTDAYQLLAGIIAYLARVHGDEVREMKLFQYMSRNQEQGREWNMKGVGIGIIHSITDLGG